jgi:hypothetical protein
MNTDKKVEALEQEVALLKAQIQTILLDIQEQLLTNAYPSLRAEEVTPPPPPTSNFDSPNVRNVSVDNYQGSAPVEQNRVQRYEPRIQDTLEADPNPTHMKNPLRKMRLTDDVADFSEEEEDLPVVRSVSKAPNSDERYARPAQQPVAKPAAKPAPRPTPLPSSPQQIPAKQTSQAAKSKTQAANSGKAGAKPKSEPSAAPTSAQKLRQTGKFSIKKTQPGQTGEHEQVPQKSNLVLRLIAGVQNAGVGITRKKTKYG